MTAPTPVGAGDTTDPPTAPRTDPLAGISPTTSAFLRTVYNLYEDHVPIRRARIRERLKLSGPTVTQAVTRMIDTGLLEVRHEQYLTFTDRGLQVAVIAVRRHRLAERLLTDILSLPPLQAHGEATRWGQMIGEETERAIVASLDDPTTSPWGNPIPGLESVGGPEPTFVEPDLLYQLGPPGSTFDALVRSLSEDAQDDEQAITALVGAGIVPGAQIKITVGKDRFELRGLGRYDLPVKNAHRVRVDVVRP
ncbi:MAG: metal-dependent transcriptional regulator [Gordonia sp. (in: high G+C Gram-positive bacteria)]|uniref:metal-dependent transcriptional regulator n=1 Tax=Gordonia sp. (in: high G+C Gram-positive bacteria) TaxID=84139 RepID=UPI0039E6DDCE